MTPDPEYIRESEAGMSGDHLLKLASDVYELREILANNGFQKAALKAWKIHDALRDAAKGGYTHDELNALYQIRCLLDPDKPERKMQDELVDAVREMKATIEKLPKAWRIDEHGKLVKDVPVVPDVDSVWVVYSRKKEKQAFFEIAWHGHLNNGICGTTPEAALLAAKEMK
jgi:hypothetical protein